MKILVLGAGVLGCNLAMNLFLAGKDVALLARGNWGEHIEKNGLTVKYRYSFKKKNAKIPVVHTLNAQDAYDMIFVAVRFTQLDSVMPMLRENVSRNIVFVGNNTRAERCAAALPDKNVMFAFASSAGHREKEYVASLDLKKITIGQLKNAPSNERLIQSVFADTPYKVAYEPNMNDYLLSHAAFIIPCVFACYYTNGNLKKIGRNKAYIERIIRANIEGYSALEKAGHEILPSGDNNFRSEKYHKTCCKVYKLMCRTSIGKICASDHAMNAVGEMSALNKDLKAIFANANAPFEEWKRLESEVSEYLK